MPPVRVGLTKNKIYRGKFFWWLSPSLTLTGSPFILRVQANAYFSTILTGSSSLLLCGRVLTLYSLITRAIGSFASFYPVLVPYQGWTEDINYT
ncbi:hypothetical protein B0T22DRAFT_305681 [Podospora appendiculata]|uniref:Uncharacterized protein n=1 Tax=Podospora appendiculata TaxID=314037 RepID=A0AAE0X010_9PEZI|nr:hypothetical protein B0T22DRAFT_305681 [Podospora appendiculata]